MYASREFELYTWFRRTPKKNSGSVVGQYSMLDPA